MYCDADYYSFQYHLEDESKPPPRLPAWLELPKGIVKNRNFSVPGDFLMLAEGSEVEGPIPRLVIPRMGNGDFNLDHFSVCLMSTDMQTQNGLLNFCMNGDAQLLMSQNDQGLFSFVQHFTLHDTMARGFVRPFCLAYLSRDKNKLVHFQDRLSYEFGRVVSQYKLGNFLMFFQDMLHTLSDLQYTREKHLEGMETGLPLDYNDDDDLTDGIQVKALAIKTGNEQVSASCQSSSQTLETSHHKQLIIEDSLFSPPSTSLKGNNLKKGCHIKSEDQELNSGPSVSSPSMFPEEPDHADFSKNDLLKTDVSDKSVVNCTILIKDPHVQLKEFDDAIREVREILTTVSNLLEKHHIEVKERISPRSDEAPRRTPLDNKNFHMAQHLEETSYHLQRDLEPSWIKWTYAEDSYKPKFRKSLRVKIQKKLRSFELLTKPTFDDYELLHSLYRYFNRSHLTLAMELDDIKDLDPPEGLLTIGRVVYLNFLSNFERSPKVRQNNVCDRVTEPDVLSVGSPVNVLVKEWMSESTVVGFHACSSYGMSNSEVGHLHDSMEREDTFHMEEYINNIRDDNVSQGSEQTITNRPTHLDLNTDGKAIEICRKKVTPPEKASVVSFADHISTFTCSKRIGSGIARLFHIYQSQALDMVYSLLIGRPLIIYTSSQINEAEIRDVVTALWICVPGHYNVLPWVMKPLSMQDMAHLKLVGMLKKDDNLVPLAIQGSTSFFDINRKKYSGPSYEIGMLLDVINKKPGYHDEQSFVAYLHSLLFSLANKAFLYFHGFCMNDEKQEEISSSLWQKRMQRYEQSEAFLKCVLKVSGSDACIVRYLSNVVKEQLRKRGISQNVTHISLNQVPRWIAKS